MKLYMYHLWFCSRLGEAQIGGGSTLSKAVTISRNYRIKEQQQQHQQHSPDWDHQYSGLVEMRKSSGMKNNNNNDNTYPTDGTSHCIGCGTSKCNKDDINRSRSISMQRSGHMAGHSVLSHTHCVEDQPVAKSQRCHLHRSRSKTVSTNLCDNNSSRCDPTTISTDQLLSKRRNKHVQLCPPANVSPLASAELINTHSSSFTNADLVNGNILNIIPCTDSTKAPPRIICRNRSRISTKCAQPQILCNKTNTSGTIVNTSMKRGKRTLSSTQIEREKSDEKNIKLKKHAVLRSLSPILVASSARSTTKKIISAPITKWF